MPTNWKYIKKLLEKEFLCEKLRGHITYDLTDYRPAPWYQQHFIMKCDDTILLEASQPHCEWDKRFNYPTVEYGACQMIAEKACLRFGESGIPQAEVERITRFTTNEVMAYISHYNAVYGVAEIIDAIGVYLHSDIEKSLSSEEFFILALAILDRRCGKRKLEKFAEWNYVSYPNWLRDIFRLRFEAEGLAYSKAFEKCS